ncbi:MAG TPA: hypothetical protein DDY17_04075 [Syntrophaceae bacterium]|jgi:hypothetical protein|nr:hypothetical protein [Syntrophaceae bacterium]
MTHSLDLAQLKLRQAAIEIRYDNAYTLWDRAGRIWSRASSEWSNLKMIEAAPNITKFILNDRMELQVKLDRAHLIDLKASSSLKEFIEIAEIFVDIVAISLDISRFTRLGFRLTYYKNFPDKASAANVLLACKKLVVPEGKHFNIQGKVLLPRYSLLWEGESTAIQVTFAAQDRKIELDISPGIEELESVHMEKHEIVYDIDYYTLNHISKGQLNVKDWIEQTYHLIKRDSRVFMGV